MPSLTLPGTKPSRPSYPPPLPVGAPVHPGGADTATRTFRRQKQVGDDIYARWRAAHRPDIEPDVLKGNAGIFSVSDAALTLPGAIAEMQDEAKVATKKANDLIKNSRVKADDVASQIGAQRYSSQWQRSLDAIKDGPKAVAAAQEMVANADDAQIPVLAEELGDYLSSRNLPSGWLPEALADKIPGLREATADAILKARQLAVLQFNHGQLQKAFEKDLAAPKLLDPADQTSEPYSDYTG